MNRADRLQDGGRKGTVGFALAALQRRLASSPEAIYQSLRRRHEKMKRRLEEERLRSRGTLAMQDFEKSVPDDIWDSSDQMQAEEFEDFEEEVVTGQQPPKQSRNSTQRSPSLRFSKSRRSGSGTRTRIVSGMSFPPLARNTRHAGCRRNQRKLIIFTEHRDTLHYLERKIRDLLGSAESVVHIHGGIHRDERRKVQEVFRNDPLPRCYLQQMQQAKA